MTARRKLHKNNPFPFICNYEKDRKMFQKGNNRLFFQDRSRLRYKKYSSIIVVVKTMISSHSFLIMMTGGVPKSG